jgi:hypothetical protein
VKRGGKWVVVDAKGKRRGGPFEEGRARAEAKRINDAWARARSESKAKGGLAEAELEEFAGQVLLGRDRHVRFDPHLHPRNRLGEFRDVLGQLLKSPAGSTAKLPSGVTVKRTAAGLHVEGFEPRIPGFLGETRSPSVAAGKALHLHDEKMIRSG